MADVTMREHAPAKVNLALHVTGRRRDGYHLLDSLVCFTDIGDEIVLSPGPLSLTIDGPFKDGLETGNDNLCLKAARLAGGQARLRLTKNLPVASGIGGGSSDAAAVLRGLARMGCPLPDNPERLGADVPVCLASKPARMQGIGEQLTLLPPLPQLHLVLVNPGLSLSTPQVFAALREHQNAPLAPIPDFPDSATLIKWLRHTRNDLEAPACRIAPVIGEVMAALRGTGAGFARMSGSGATCFGIYDEPKAAEQAAGLLRKHGFWAVHTQLALPPVTG